VKKLVLLAVLLVAGGGSLAASGSLGAGAAPLGAGAADPAIVSVYSVAKPRGLMVTSGGWAYCEQVRALARTTRYTLLCGRYREDGYVGYGLRSRRHLDWGNPAYLASLATKIQALHRHVGGDLVLIGVSYSGFAVATLASHHPGLRPSQLIVIDSYLDLVARRAALPSTHETAREIDLETGGSAAALAARDVSVEGLAHLVETGTRLTVIWSISADEQKEFSGATCNRGANASVLLRLAGTLDRPVVGWVTMSRHGHDLWDRGAAIVGGRVPGRQVTFRPGGVIPAGAACA
jgi:pimeloyl-ACP methyl ester carboxylesterase